MSSKKHDDLLRRATEAAREGKKQEARGYLEEILEEDEENIRAWMLFYRVTDDVNEKKIALTTVLQLDPGNARAQEALNKLEGKLSRDKEEIAPGVSRRQIAILGGIVAVAVLFIVVILIGVNASRGAQTQQATQAAVGLVLTQTQIEVQKTVDTENLTATSIAATETQLAITSPTPSPTETRAGPPTLPPTFTPTPLPAQAMTPTPLAQPPSMPGTILGWGGPDLINDGFLPILRFPITGGGQFQEISLGERGRNVAASSLSNVIYSRYVKDTFQWALQKIDIAQGNTALMSVQWEGQTQVQFSRSDEPQLSVDGRFLVFTAVDQNTARRNVFLYDSQAPAGTDPVKRLATDDKVYEYPAISPDGRSVVVVQIDENQLAPSRDLVFINTETLEIRPLTSDGMASLEFSPRWSPDGQILSYAASTDANPDSHEIFIRTSDGVGGAINITNHPSDDILPVFSPDSRFIAFSSNRQENYNIYIYDMFGTAADSTYQLTSQGDDFFTGAWVP